jgi:uncharacterized membrane protein YdjX (TVP38/TMEM64 family)
VGQRVNASRNTDAQRLSKAIKTGAFAVVVALAVTGVTATWWGWEEQFSARDLEEKIRSWGTWGVAAAIGLMVLHSFVPFPAEFVAIANGMCFGPLWGTAITWTGAMLGAFVAFGLSRRLGRPFARTMVARRHWQAIDEWAGREGWQVLFLSRFTPVIAFNLVNYAAGLTRISWVTFAWTTALGILPMTLLMVLLGDSVETLDWPVWVAVMAGGVAAWLLLRCPLRRARTNTAAEDRP